MNSQPYLLDETTDPAPTEPFPTLDMAALRDASERLRHGVISGGLPYILVSVDPESHEATLEQVGFEPDSVSGALTEVAAIFSRGDAEPIDRPFTGSGDLQLSGVAVEGE